jgi:hypothetical protein
MKQQTKQSKGRPAIAGLKRRTTTATDREWTAMLIARDQVRQQLRESK